MTVWQIILALAALYNFAIGGVGLARKGASLDGRLVGLLVLCFGIVYALAAIDIERFLPVLWAGVVGKLGVVAFMVPAIARGDVPRRMVPVIAVDAVFAGFFLFVLLAPAAA